MWEFNESVSTEFLTQEEHKKEEIISTTKVQTDKKYKWNVVWVNVIALTLFHVAAMYGFFIRNTGKTESVVFGKTLGSFGLIAVTSGAHRLWSHNSYKANAIVQFLLALMFTTLFQNSIYVWARDHRVHHKYSETDADPHNAKRGFFFSHMGWLMVRKQKEVIEKGKTIDMSDLKSNPIVMFQHKYYVLLMPIFTFIIPTIIPWYFWNESFTVSFFAVTMYRYMLINHLIWCTNSLAHRIGNKPYDKNIWATENLVMALMGEGSHNYHHTYPWDYRSSEFGDEWIDVSTIVVDFFAFLGWVTNRKTVSPQIVQKRVDQTGDGSPRYRNFYDILIKLKKSVFTKTINLLILCLIFYCI